MKKSSFICSNLKKPGTLLRVFLFERARQEANGLCKVVALSLFDNSFVRLTMVLRIGIRQRLLCQNFLNSFP